MKRFLILAALLVAFVAPTAFAATPEKDVVKVTNSNYETLTKQHKLLVVDFYADWCGPCRALAPILKELAADYAGKVVVGKCNVDENRELTAQFGINSIPAIFIIKNGKIVDKQIGYCEKAVLKAKIDKWK